MDALPLESDRSLVFLYPGQHKQQRAEVLGPAAVRPGLVIPG